MISLSPKSFGVKTTATPARAAPGVGLRDDSADDDGDVTGAGVAQAAENLGHQLHVGAGEDREPDEVDVLGHRGGDDLVGGQPDPLVDDLEAGVAGADGDLLGAVAVSVETRLGDQHAQPLPELLLRAGRRPPAGQGVARLGAPTPTDPETPVGARNSPNSLAQGRPTRRS